MPGMANVVMQTRCSARRPAPDPGCDISGEIREHGTDARDGKRNGERVAPIGTNAQVHGSSNIPESERKVDGVFRHEGHEDEHRYGQDDGDGRRDYDEIAHGIARPTGRDIALLLHESHAIGVLVKYIDDEGHDSRDEQDKADGGAGAEIEESDDFLVHEHGQCHSFAADHEGERRNRLPRE